MHAGPLWRSVSVPIRGCGENVSPSPLEERPRDAPSPELFFNLGAQNGKLWCILGANFIAVELSVLHA